MGALWVQGSILASPPGPPAPPSKPLLMTAKTSAKMADNGYGKSTLVSFCVCACVWFVFAVVCMCFVLVWVAPLMCLCVAWLVSVSLNVGLFLVGNVMLRRMLVTTEAFKTSCWGRRSPAAGHSISTSI